MGAEVWIMSGMKVAGPLRRTALTSFAYFDHRLHPDSPVYWFIMQIGMVIGFATSFPMNWWLIKCGLKETM